jgi:ABC-type polysaccharide/polyol phosphate export permease
MQTVCSHWHRLDLTDFSKGTKKIFSYAVAHVSLTHCIFAVLDGKIIEKLTSETIKRASSRAVDAAGLFNYITTKNQQITTTKVWWPLVIDCVKNLVCVNLPGIDLY